MADLSLDKVSDEVLYRAAALAEGYESVPVSIDQFINDPYYLGQIYGNGGIYPFWVDALRKIYPNPLYSPYEEVCLSGDTEVDLLDGTTRTMAQICANGPDKVFWVLGYNLNTKEWEPCRAGAAKMTGVKPVYKVTLDNGKSFKATGNHKILGKDNRWHRVDSLKVGQSLMPYNLEYDDLGYAWVWDNRTQKKVPRARLVRIWKYSIPGGYHKNQVKADDRPSNLMCCLARRAALEAKRPEILEQTRNCNRQIVTIEELPPEPVFNFTVDILHSYPLSCGIVSSNCITGAIGVGKAVTVDTVLNCQGGGKAAHSVQLDDKVLGSDGEYHQILGIYPQGRKHTYTFVVSYDEGGLDEADRVTTSDDHIWTVLVDGQPKDMVTRELVEGMSRQGQYKTYQLPVIKGEHPRYVVGFEDAGDQECVCFQVDSLDHLFSVNNFTLTHNTTVSLVGALYDLYHVILLKDPHKKYKLLPTTSIIFSLVTATMDLAAAVMANQFLDAMGASPFFCEHFSPKKGERLDEDMFPHHIGIGFGSRGGHNLGKAVIGAIIDEANFQDRVANQAVENYNTITRRMKSRFMLPGGTLPCRRWVISSRTDSAAFLESHIDAVRNRNDVVIFEPAIWDVQKVKGIYSGVTFPVFVGNAVEQPRILTTDQEVENCAGYVIQVPIEYRTEFEEDLPKSLQDLAGVATRSGVNLIYNVEKLEEALCLDNCMSTDEPRLTLTGDDHLIQYYKKPLPPGNYYVHLDGAKSGDRYGFAMSRVVEQISVTTHSAMTGVEYSKISPAVDTPLCFGIKALPGSEIPLWKVRQFLVDLRNQHVNIAHVSFDGYQSVDNAQLLAKLGFDCGYSSVDRTKDPYLKLASNISLGLHKMPRSKILRTELLNLQNLPQKIDHPMTVVVDGKQVKGGKDIADAVCASAFNAISAAMTLTQSNMIEQMKSTPTQMSMRERQEFVMKNYLGLG